MKINCEIPDQNLGQKSPAKFNILAWAGRRDSMHNDNNFRKPCWLLPEWPVVDGGEVAVEC
jgi:hypothetical protein